MLFVLQAFRRPGMLVQDARTFPYLKHFFVFVVISHLVLAAFYFTVGTLTRNARIVYGLAISFYPLYITYQIVLLKSLPSRWRSVLDPLLMNWGDKYTQGRSADLVNHLAVTYDSDLIANRALMILIAAICLTILYARFAIAERPGNQEKFSVLNLSTAAEGVYFDAERFKETNRSLPSAVRTGHPDTFKNPGNSVPLPVVNRASAGIHLYLNKLIGAIHIEFQLLRTERSLVVIVPMAVLLSFLSQPFQAAFSGQAYSAAYASSVASGILVFLLGVIVFYTGEAMHRDRELRIEPVLWSMPSPNSVFLLSKFLTTILLALALIVLADLTAILTQLLRGHRPVEISAYLITYVVILFPTIAFLTAASMALNVFLRDKYFAYAVCIGIGGGLYYLYNLGHNHWFYNPALYRLWAYSDLVGSGQGQILTHRIYCLALSGLCLALAQFGFRRKSAKGFRINGRLGSTGWAVVAMIASAVVAVVTALMIK
jgi:hypothetical protein